MILFFRSIAFGIMGGIFSVALTKMTVGFSYNTLDERLWVLCLFLVSGIVSGCIYRLDPEKAWNLFTIWRKLIPAPGEKK